MNRSRHQAIGRAAQPDAEIRSGLFRHMPLATAISAVLAGVPAAQAQQKPDVSGGLEEVVVTAQKKSERMQDVPVAIVALGTEKLEELHVTNLDDYVKYLPSVSYSRGQGQGGNGQPGSSHVYMRGVVSGANENHSGSQPSVGTYLDEQPVTTIDGTVDVHVYDIARVEVLEGPQGTLYGASSQAGTIRIITNKPDPSKFEASYNLGINSIDHGGVGYTLEGFVNIPLSPIAAVRLVAWDEHDGGFINNVAGTNAAAGIFNGTRDFSAWDAANGGTGAIGAGKISNAAYVKNHYNTVDTKGGRAALKLNLGDNWTVTPTVMGQSVNSEGFFGYDPAVGDLQLVHFAPENSQDSWVQGALTVEGKISDFDLVYAGAYMKRNTHSIADYSDYSFFYDKAGYGQYWLGNAGLKKDANGFVTGGIPIDPQQIVVSKGYFEKFSHELRISTPQQYPVKATAGVFVQRQLHDIFEQYDMPGYGFTFSGSPYGGPNPAGLADYLSIPTLPNTVWLTDEQRVDRDQAAFAQVTWDVTSKLSAQVGYRYFKTDNTLQGFYGYSKNFGYWFGAHSGERICFNPNPTVNGIPCTDLDQRIADSGHVPRVNVSYKITPDKMIYATYSKGFRPGGVNRTAAAGYGPYQADFLTNYEAGWKTQWLNHRIRWNGSLFWENWDDFQFSFLGPNSVTIVQNAGSARIKGIESDFEWAVGGGLVVSLNATLLQSRLTTNYCGIKNPVTFELVTTPDCTYTQADGTLSAPFSPQAPNGADLPIAPKFKANTVVRYGFGIGTWDADVQGTFVYQTQTAPALKTQDQQFIGMQPAYYLLDLSSGIERNGMRWEFLISNVTDKRAQLSRFEQCTVNVCTQPYIIPAQPRTVALRFGQKF